MKAILIGAATLALAAAGAFAQGQTGGPQGQGYDLAQGGHTICLYPPQIYYTTVVDANTILFHMKDGAIWKNTLKGPCRGLAFSGFSYVNRENEVCANAAPIEVIKTGEVCALGNFTPYKPAPNPG